MLVFGFDELRLLNESRDGLEVDGYRLADSSGHRGLLLQIFQARGQLRSGLCSNVEVVGEVVFHQLDDLLIGNQLLEVAADLIVIFRCCWGYELTPDMLRLTDSAVTYVNASSV